MLDCNDMLSVQRRQEDDAGIDRLIFNLVVIQFTDNNGTRAAVALGAAFLGTGQPFLQAEILQDGRGRRQVRNFSHFIVEYEFYDVRHGVYNTGNFCYLSSPALIVMLLRSEESTGEKHGRN
jgi:hypothetical protein